MLNPETDWGSPSQFENKKTGGRDETWLIAGLDSSAGSASLNKYLLLHAFPRSDFGFPET